MADESRLKMASRRDVSTRSLLSETGFVLVLTTLQCSVCGRSFARNEHLLRHRRTREYQVAYTRRLGR